MPKPAIPNEGESATLTFGSQKVALTNLSKMFWPQERITKRDLLRYYLAMAPALLPHLKDRAMVMKRYPHGVEGKFFFMKRAPTPRPDWIEVCSIEHGSGSVIDFPIINDEAALMWVINLGCIDLNPWYARCSDYNRPDFLHFDLDPVPGATFEQVCETALVLHDALAKLKMPAYVKTTGSKGLHVYVPIEHGPLQKLVWTFAKSLALKLAELYPELITAEYRIAKRPKARVLVDYNQNAWGRTLASIYSVRPRPRAPVSTPLRWEEVEGGVSIEGFRIDNVPERVREEGDLWKGVLAKRGRFELERYL